MPVNFIPRALLCALTIGVTMQDLEAATVYQCVSFKGARYVSAEPCGNSNGVIVDMTQAPDGLPRAEQLKIAQDAFNRKQEATAPQKQSDREKAQREQCAAIAKELGAIKNRYANMQYVPVEQVNADQARSRAISARQSALGCQGK